MLEPRTALTFLLCIGLMVSGVTMLEAAEIKVIAGAAFSPAMRELEPQFERESGHTVKIQYGIAGTIKRMIETGEPFDLAILPVGQLNDLAGLGRIVEETRTPVVRVGMAAGTRAGAPRPDIASVEAFKRALLNAKSIAYPPEGAIGLHLAKVFERLGISEQMKGKIKPLRDVSDVPKVLAAGEAELGFAPATVITAKPGVDVIGPLPAELQSYIVYGGAVAKITDQRAAATALLKHLTTADSFMRLKSLGYQPAEASP